MWLGIGLGLGLGVGDVSGKPNTNPNPNPNPSPNPNPNPNPSLGPNHLLQDGAEVALRILHVGRVQVRVGAKHVAALALRTAEEGRAHLGQG